MGRQKVINVVEKKKKRVSIYRTSKYGFLRTLI